MDKVVVIVKKFGKPTLQEQMEGLLQHRVTISEKAKTRTQTSRSSFFRFSYSCTCVAKKPVCIHIALVLMSQFPKK